MSGIKCSFARSCWPCSERQAQMIWEFSNRLLTLASEANFFRSPWVDPKFWRTLFWLFFWNNYLWIIKLVSFNILLTRVVRELLCRCEILWLLLLRAKAAAQPGLIHLPCSCTNLSVWGLQDWLYIQDIFNYMKQFEGVAYFNSFSQINRRNQIKFSRFSY